MKTLSLVSVLAIAFTIVYAQNWLDNLASGGCLATITPKLTSDCSSAFDEEVKDRPKDEDGKKTLCCAYLRMESCVLKIAEKDCGENGKNIAKSFMNSINRGITSEDCVDYGFITCITITQMAIAGAVVLALLALLSCICCCCCRR